MHTLGQCLNPSSIAGSSPRSPKAAPHPLALEMNSTMSNPHPLSILVRPLNKPINQHSGPTP